MQYADQSAATLNLKIALGSQDLEQFTLLASSDLVGGVTEHSLSYHIIGESHILVIRNGDHELWEIFSCAHGSRVRQVMHHDTIQNLMDGPPVHFKLPFADYRFGLWTVPDDQVRVQDLVNKDHALVFDFPAAESSKEIPKTIVVPKLYPSWDHDSSMCQSTFEVRTAHTYPDEGLVVMTKSLIVIESTQ